jgi:signal transduction histidine kinase/CheY-like chemotaxis protein
MRATLLSIVGLLLMITLIVMFFSKKTYPSYETKIYRSFLITATAFIVVGILTFIVAKATNDFDKIALFQKVYMSLLVLLNYLSVKYCLSLFFQNKENKKFNWFIKIATFIFIILIFVLHLSPVYYDDVLYGSGPSYDVAMVNTFISFLFFIVISIYLLIKQITPKKIVPFLILIGLYVLTFVFRNYYTELTFEGFFYAYILLVMYHTIENPDIKMLEEYNRNKELTERSIEDRSNMLFKISEEVRNPIRKVELLNSSILKSNNIDDIHTTSHNIEDVLNGLTNMVDEVLNISDIDKQKIKLVDVTYDIYNLFNQIIYIIKSKVKSNVEFKYSISDAIPARLYGDSSKMKQVICSLVFNAFDHTEEGNVDLDISSIIKDNVCRLIITIRDTGNGMSLQNINNVLEGEKDVSSEELENANDLNINLKVIKKIVNLMGGVLLIKSEENQGTTSTIVLNQLMETTDKDYSLDPLSKKLSNKRRVLIVDDDYKELESYINELEKNNYNVVSTMYGKDGVDKIKQDSDYDLIFIDDEMEGYSAVKIIDELKEDVDLSKLTIIVMLEKDKERIKEHYLQDYPFADYLLKEDYKEEIKRIKDKFR